MTLTFIPCLFDGIWCRVISSWIFRGSVSIDGDLPEFSVFGLL